MLQHCPVAAKLLWPKGRRQFQSFIGATAHHPITRRYLDAMLKWYESGGEGIEKGCSSSFISNGLVLLGSSRGLVGGGSSLFASFLGFCCSCGSYGSSQANKSIISCSYISRCLGNMNISLLFRCRHGSVPGTTSTAEPTAPAHTALQCILSAASDE